MAVKRIPATAINAGETYQDGDIITGQMVNQVVKVLKDGVNYNKFFIDAMFSGTTEEAIVIGVPKGTLNDVAEDIAQLESYIGTTGISVADGQKAFIFRCVYENEADPTEITGVVALNYYKYTTTTEEWEHQYAVSMDTFIQGVSSDFTDYPNIVEPSLGSIVVVQDDAVLQSVSLQNIKNVLGVSELINVTVPAIEQDISEILDGTQTVKKSEQDASGNVITTTYETKSAVTSKLALKSDKTYVDSQDQSLDNKIALLDERLGIDESDIYAVEGRLDTAEGDIDTLQSTKVPKTTTIIGLDLQDNILIGEFRTALGNATQSVAGLLSAEDKTHLDGLVALLENSDGDTIVDTIGEILAIFQNYPEGADLVTVLQGKVDKVVGKELSTNDFTDLLKSKLDSLLDGTQYYDKTYIDSLKDQNGWESELLTLTPLTNGQTITTATLKSYDTLKLLVRDTNTAFVDTDSVEASLLDVGDMIKLNDETVYLEIGTTNSTFNAPLYTGWELQIVGLKYTELKAVATTYDNVISGLYAENVQEAIDELQDEKVAKMDIVDNLTTDTQPKVLSAKQGKVLQDTKEALANKATDFSVVDDTKYPTTKAVSERLLNLPIAELNNHTLREVFEDGNFNITLENQTYRIYLNPTNINVGDVYYTYGGITLNVGTFAFIIQSTTGQERIFQLPNMLSSVNTLYDKTNTDRTRVFTDSGSNYDIDINFVSMTSLGISSHTVSEMDYWFNVYQGLKTSETNAIFTMFAPKQQEAWLTPTLTGATSTYIRYRKDTIGTVIVEGNITVTTAGTNLTLPIGYRPLFAYTVGNLTFNTDGTVVSSATGTQTLSVRYTGA